MRLQLQLGLQRLVQMFLMIPLCVVYDESIHDPELNKIFIVSLYMSLMLGYW